MKTVICKLKLKFESWVMHKSLFNLFNEWLQVTSSTTLISNNMNRKIMKKSQVSQFNIIDIKITAKIYKYKK